MEVLNRRSCNQLNMDAPTVKYDRRRKDDHRAVLVEFRRNLHDVLQPQHDDLYLYRFLKARDFDLIKAEKMIRETLKFRAKINAASLLTGEYELPEVYLKHQVTFSLGYDKDNNPIRVFMIGLCDCKGFVYSLRTIDILKLTMYFLESDIKMLQEKKKKVPVFEDKTTFILDFKNFSLKQFYDKAVISAGIQLLTMYQDHYPETLKAAYLINDDYKEHLRSMMDPQNLPAFMGGDLTDPDGNPNCTSLVNWNPKIDSSYYTKQNGQRRESADASLKTSTIHQRSTLQIPVEVTTAGLVLKWTFWTKEYNIKFGLFFKRDRSHMEEILPVEGVDCQIIPEENEFICDRIGTYVLHFDNSYSWLTSKQIWYKVDVIPTKQ